MNYPFTDVFLICFNVSNGKSFENVRSYCKPELTLHVPKKPWLLVGCKIDLRPETPIIDTISSTGNITEAEGDSSVLSVTDPAKAHFIELAKETTDITKIAEMEKVTEIGSKKALINVELGREEATILNAVDYS